MMEALVAISQEEKVRHDTLLCVVCWEDKKTVACLPCGHVVYCAGCAINPSTLLASSLGTSIIVPPDNMKSCPVCRAVVTNLCKLYF